MKFTVLVFLGPNCDRDMHNTAIKTGAEVEYVSYRETPLNGLDGVLIPGDSSFGDYLRSGATANVASIISEVKRLVSEGKPVLGVCSGSQVLTEIGLLPGALLHNDSYLFISRNEKLRVVNNQTPLINLYGENEIVVYPAAHGGERYYCTDDMYNKLVESSQTILTYEDNPNGSHEHIAGIVGKTGNICEMMSHPERALKILLSTDSGIRLFEATVNS